MAGRTVSFTTFNLLNLNEPGLPLYRDRDGWDAEVHARKVAWTASKLREMPADVFGFQELWHAASLDAVLEAAGMADDYVALVPPGQAGQGIVCATAVSRAVLAGEPEWITGFPPDFVLRSGGDDPQAPDVSVRIDGFSRPVLSFPIRPRARGPEIDVYVCHLKSKAPTRIHREPWYERDAHARHAEAIGAALSTIRRTAEAMALRMILTDAMRGNDRPAVVLGDCNDGQHSNTLDILTGQPRFLAALSRGGGDADLYTAQTLQQYRSETDVYYTHVFQERRQSLDHILVSQEFYDMSRRRLWAFDGLEISNDHLNADDHATSGTGDHGVVRATFRWAPAG